MPTCVCASTEPGNASRPRPSYTRRASAAAISGATRAMRPSLTPISPRSTSGLVGRTTRTFLIRRSSAGSAIRPGIAPSAPRAVKARETTRRVDSPRRAGYGWRALTMELTAAALPDAVRAKRVSPVELVLECLARIERLGRGGGRRARRRRDRQRHRRLDPAARGLLRRGRAQADVRPREPGRGDAAVVDDGPHRAAGGDGDGRRAAVRGDGRTRRRGSDLEPAAGGRRRRRARGAGHRPARRGARGALLP